MKENKEHKIDGSEIMSPNQASPNSPESEDRMDTINVLRARLVTLKHSKGRSAEEFFDEFFAEHRL